MLNLGDKHALIEGTIQRSLNLTWFLSDISNSVIIFNIFRFSDFSGYNILYEFFIFFQPCGNHAPLINTCSSLWMLM